MAEIFRPQKIKAMIFDVGGVLAIDAPRYFLSELSVKEGIEVSELVLMWRKNFPKLVRGKMSENDFWLAFISDLNLKVEPEELLARFKKEIRLFILLDKQFFAYLTQLKEAINKDRRDPIRFAVLSNNVREWAAELESQADFDALFDKKIYSFDEVMVKPDPALYKSAISKIGVDPEEALFVDNKKSNVDAAKASGMIGLTFTTPEDFQSEMITLKMVKPS